MKEFEDALSHMIIEMRNGRDQIDICEDIAVQSAFDYKDIITFNKNDLIDAAQHIIYDLYDGKFPVDHLEVGDICYDTIGNKCVVTNVDKSIHVLYPNGKTYKFPKHLEEKFKKTNATLKKNLTSILLYLERAAE